MEIRYILVFSLGLLIQNILTAQIGGDNVYEFLNLTSSARITALGGNLISVRDDDISLAFANPASLNPAMHQSIAFNHSFHFEGIQNGYFTYGHHIDKWKTSFHAGIKYASYGDFNKTDIYGNSEGKFDASEYAITFGAGRELYERMSVGANLKFISSQLESYNSFGIATDLAAMFYDTTKRINISLVFKNIGGQITSYRADNIEPIPFEMQVGISKRLKHLPFRFSVIFHNLNRWNILYDDPNQEEDSFIIIGDETSSENPFLDNLLRHFIINGEFLIGKKENLRLRVGYNHLLHREQTVKNYRSFAGFTFGFGIKVNRFRLDYGRGVYHLAGSVNHISLSTNIKEFKR